MCRTKLSGLYRPKSSDVEVVHKSNTFVPTTKRYECILYLSLIVNTQMAFIKRRLRRSAFCYKMMQGYWVLKHHVSQKHKLDMTSKEETRHRKMLIKNFWKSYYFSFLLNELKIRMNPMCYSNPRNYMTQIANIAPKICTIVEASCHSCHEPMMNHKMCLTILQRP